MNMKKRICGLVLVLAFIVSMFLTTVKAESTEKKDSIPTKVRLYNGFNQEAIKIELADTTQSIVNVKSNNKNMKAMLTASDYIYESSSYLENAMERNSYTIGVLSKKDGTYTVSFDIVDKDNKKVSTKEVKVYAYKSPIKSITFDGKNLNGNLLTGKSAKIKVTLTSGNKINKLRYGMYKLVELDKDNVKCQEVYKGFKNGSKITFGTQPYYYLSVHASDYGDSKYESRYMSSGMTIPTFIEITYYDVYTKRNETIIQQYYKEVE